MVQFPEAGKPCNCTLPVATVQVGCVISPNMGTGKIVVKFLESDQELVPLSFDAFNLQKY
jgi:hypothetical protein